jgi:hypothetical protein
MRFLLNHIKEKAKNVYNVQLTTNNDMKKLSS